MRLGPFPSDKRTGPRGDSYKIRRLLFVKDITLAERVVAKFEIHTS